MRLAPFLHLGMLRHFQNFLLKLKLQALTTLPASKILIRHSKRAACWLRVLTYFCMKWLIVGIVLNGGFLPCVYYPCWICLLMVNVKESYALILLQGFTWITRTLPLITFYMLCFQSITWFFNQRRIILHIHFYVFLVLYKVMSMCSPIYMILQYIYLYAWVIYRNISYKYAGIVFIYSIQVWDVSRKALLCIALPCHWQIHVATVYLQCTK